MCSRKFFFFATLNQGGMLENDSKLNHIGSYLVGVLNIYLFYLLLSSGLLVFFCYHFHDFSL